MYLGRNGGLPEERRRFIVECQDARTGFMIGPELRDFEPPPQAIHDRGHLLMHLTSRRFQRVSTLTFR